MGTTLPGLLTATDISENNPQEHIDVNSEVFSNEKGKIECMSKHDTNIDLLIMGSKSSYLQDNVEGVKETFNSR
jgi:hypothetical protein